MEGFISGNKKFRKNMAEKMPEFTGVRKAKEEREANKISRRDFFKKAGALALEAAIVTSGAAVLGKIAQETSSKKTRNNESERQPIEKEQEDIPPEQIYESEEEVEKVELDEENKIMMAEILRPSVHKELKINPEVIEMVTKYWTFQYQNRRKPELDKAYDEMEKIKPLLAECFRRHNMPEQLMYLAIPESNWMMDAVSRCGARGPYQFMPKIAKEYGLKDPTDPLKSADACARYLKDLYKRTHSWDLALAGYNGIVGHYLTECHQNETQPSYEKYLGFLQRKINEKRRAILKKSYFSHIVKEREMKVRQDGVDRIIWRMETLEDIAFKYGVTVNQLIKDNPQLKPKKTRRWRMRKINTQPTPFEGQKLIVRFNHKSQQAKFEEEIAGFIENTNYPSRIKGVWFAKGMEMLPEQEIN